MSTQSKIRPLLAGLVASMVMATSSALAHDVPVCDNGSIWIHKEEGRIWALEFSDQAERKTLFDPKLWTDPDATAFDYKIGFHVYDGKKRVAYVAAPRFCTNGTGLCTARVAMADGEMIESQITWVEEGESIPYVVFSGLREQIGRSIHLSGSKLGVKAQWLDKAAKSGPPLILPSLFKFSRCKK